MARSRRFARRGSRPLRGMDWDYAHLEGGTTSGSFGSRGGLSQGYVVLPSDVRARWVDPTLMATRWFCNVWTRVSLDHPVIVALGLIMWNDIDDAVPGPADGPDPLRDGDLDWVNRVAFLFHGFTTALPANSPGNSNIFDNTHLSKAKRRFGQDQGLLFVASAVDTTGANNVFDFVADVRALIKE